MMKKIDFSKLEIETRIDQFDEFDLREELGNAVFAKAATLQEDDLARKIYKSDGAIELSDDEYQILLRSLESNGIVLRVINAIKRQAEIKEKGQADGNDDK